MSFLGARRQERAFERLHRRHVAAVYRYALLVLGNADDAESATRRTFAQAHRAYLAGERPRNALNWVLAIAHRVCAREQATSSEPSPQAVEYSAAGAGRLQP